MNEFSHTVINLKCITFRKYTFLIYIIYVGIKLEKTLFVNCFRVFHTRKFIKKVIQKVIKFLFCSAPLLIQECCFFHQNTLL